MGRERNKGGVGNFYTIPKLRRTQLRNLARKYAAELLLAQDSPEWAARHGIRAELGEESEFMTELERIADRIEATIRTQPASR